MFKNVKNKKSSSSFLVKAMTFGMTGILFLGVTYGDPSYSQTKVDPVLYYRPKTQDQFIEIVQAAQVASTKAENDMQKGGAKANRDKQLCALLKSPQIKDWTGTLAEVGANSDGKGVVVVTIAKNIQIKTWNNAISDISDRTLIEPGTDVFAKASALKKGSKVRFSGSFVYDPSDCIRESSLTLNGKLKDPGFIFQFKDVAVLDAVPPPSTATPSAATPSAATSSTATPSTASPPVKVEPAAPVSPPPAQQAAPAQATAPVATSEVIKPSFDCSKASNTIEKMICASQQLSRLDVQLSEAYKAARANSANQELLKNEQIEWIKMSRKCPDEACLADFYKARINQLLK